MSQLCVIIRVRIGAVRGSEAVRRIGFIEKWGNKAGGINIRVNRDDPIESGVSEEDYSGCEANSPVYSGPGIIGAKYDIYPGLSL